MSDSHDDRMPLDMGEQDETIDLETLFGEHVPPPTAQEIELSALVVMQGRTIGVLQQRIFDLEMQLIDQMQLVVVEREKNL